MICRGHIVQVEAPNGSFDTCAFFIETQGAQDFVDDQILRAALTHNNADPKFRILPGFRIDFDNVAHLHSLQ